MSLWLEGLWGSSATGSCRYLDIILLKYFFNELVRFCLELSKAQISCMELLKWKSCPFKNPNIWKQLTGILVCPIRALSNTAAGLFIQEVAIFTGQALITMAAKAGLTVGRALPAPLLVSMVVARRAIGDTNSALWDGKRNGYSAILRPQHFCWKVNSCLQL